MENTLDSIRPSENPEERSYLFGRDPSILAYSQRPLPSKDTKKNLLSLYEVEEDSTSLTNENISEHSDSQTLQTVKVYLRLKPFPKKLKLTEEQQEAYKIVNSTTLLTKLPTFDTSGSSIYPRNNEIISRKFTFSQTFGPETTQLQLFEQTIQQQIIDFLAGQNCTIMAYGTTNSGKSYTLQGTNTSPGLIPRALESVFNNITTSPSPLYKPLHCSNVVSLNALECAQELEAKTKLLTFSSVDKHQYINTYKQMQKLLQEESIRPSQYYDAHYSVWISFAEIYNETVYDLLSNECQKKRIPLKLGTDSNGRAFIKGLKTVFVNSAVEAYQVLMSGQYNLKIAATALNAKSSRSHCIFTIILLKYYGENLPNTVEVSTFSFCDLAGSERLKKTLNIGDRLKEAQNINTSLLVLSRCLKSIHDGQLARTKTDTVGPFRESKLTRLFQRALSGKEHLALIVNINPLPNLYIETQNVLNFAAIAKKIIIERKKRIKKKSKSRFSQIVTQSMQTVTDWDITKLENVDWQRTDSVEENDSEEYVTSEEYTDLANENERLKKEITSLKNTALIRDLQSRQEMAEKYIAMINELEIDWKQRINDVEIQHEDALEWTVKQVEEFYKEKLSQLSRKKKNYSNDRSGEDADSDEDNEDFNSNIKKLIKENTEMREENETLKKTITELKTTNETLIVEKNKASFELELMKEDLNITRGLLETAQKDICSTQDGEVYIKELKSQLLAKDEQIKKLKEILNEAKEDYITITSDLRKKELYIDEQAKVIVENKEKIEDLELHIQEVNACLAEQTKMVEFLEDKLEYHNENKTPQMQEEIDILKSEKLASVESCDVTPGTEETTTKSEHQEIIATEESTANEISNPVQKEDKDTNTENVDQLNKYAEKILQLEDSLETIKKLKCDIDELNKNLEKCEMERNYLQKTLDDNNRKLSELENRLEETNLKEQEKDSEIVALQNELKKIIQKNEMAEKHDNIMESELKSAISELTQTKEMLSQKEQHVKELEIHLENSERSVKLFNLLEQNAKERQVENEHLRNLNDELRTNLTEKQSEMDAFMRNRDQTMSKYETLVKNQQEELDMQKREVMRYQELFRRQTTPTPSKDDYKQLQNRLRVLQDKLNKYETDTKAKNDLDSTSEEEATSQRQPKRRGRKALTAKQDNILVVELSGSESKRVTRNTTLPPPESSTEKRTRRKRLFIDNNSFTDVEPVAMVSSTRSLRNRKK